MTVSPAHKRRNTGLLTAIDSWLKQPISGGYCAIGWCTSTVVFVSIVALLGGPALNDTYQSVFPSWAIQHGQFSCAFPAGYRESAPLYPLIAGGISAIGHVGSAVAFPSTAKMGPDCDRAFLAINAWSLRAGALARTIDIAYISWVFLMGGVVFLLRSMGRGRTGWEPATLIGLAVLPPVWMCIEDTFHPEDLVAMGLALAAIGCARRCNWAVAGILIAFAFLSQQFALLVAVPLLVIAPPGRRLRFVFAAIATIALVAIPLLTLSSGRAGHAIFLGTGNTGGIGGTVLWEFDIHGGALFAISRIAPIALAFAVAFWSAMRLGRAALLPIPLMAVIATCLGLRLVFEQQLFGYYFMAMAVSLVVLDVAQAHIRQSLIGWLATVSAVYLVGTTTLDLVGTGWTSVLDNLIPVLLIALALSFIADQIIRRDIGRQILLWLGMVVAGLLIWNKTDVLGSPPTWFWQLVLVPLGLGLAAGPLLQSYKMPTTPSESTWNAVA